MIDNPIFIVGTERSGSNLLRLLLNELPEVTVPHPPHLMRDLTPRLPVYGDLLVDKNFRRLIEDAIRLVELHFAPWPIKLNAESLFAQALRRDLYSIYAGIYEQYREHSGKPRWACKSTFMIHHVREALAHHSRPQFIHLVRDVRDVAVSARKSIFCHYHPYFVAKLWKCEQGIAAEWAAQLPTETWLTVHYEELIANPAQEMRRICTFLNATYSEEILNYFDKKAAKDLSALSRSWENVSRPVMKENRYKFAKELKPEEITLIESVIHGLENPSPSELLKYIALENLMMWSQEARSLFKDKNAYLRWRKKVFLISRSLSKMNAWQSCRNGQKDLCKRHIADEN